jgi:hypothetical protein
LPPRARCPRRRPASSRRRRWISALADLIDADGRAAPNRRSGDELMTGGEARAILDCAEKMLEQLRTKPPIASTPGVRRAFLFKRDDLDSFRCRNVFANEMTDATGLASRMAANKMRALVMRLGVKPVCARPDFRQFPVRARRGRRRDQEGGCPSAAVAAVDYWEADR